MRFRQRRVRTTLKSFTVSVTGVRQWNNLDEEMKKLAKLSVFKKKYVEMTINRYRMTQKESMTKVRDRNL